VQGRDRKCCRVEQGMVQGRDRKEKVEGRRCRKEMGKSVRKV
jgi:hypothetical protein